MKRQAKVEKSYVAFDKARPNIRVTIRTKNAASATEIAQRIFKVDTITCFAVKK